MEAMEVDSTGRLRERLDEFLESRSFAQIVMGLSRVIPANVPQYDIGCWNAQGEWTTQNGQAHVISLINSIL